MTATIPARPPDGLVDGHETGRWVGLTKETLLRWRKEGKIPGVKLGPKTVRFNVRQVAEALGIQVDD